MAQMIAASINLLSNTSVEQNKAKSICLSSFINIYQCLYPIVQDNGKKRKDFFTAFLFCYASVMQDKKCPKRRIFGTHIFFTKCLESP